MAIQHPQLIFNESAKLLVCCKKGCRGPMQPHTSLESSREEQRSGVRHHNIIDRLSVRMYTREYMLLKRTSSDCIIALPVRPFSHTRYAPYHANPSFCHHSASPFWFQPWPRIFERKVAMSESYPLTLVPPMTPALLPLS